MFISVILRCERERASKDESASRTIACGSSPRSSVMISSVERPGPAIPTNLAKRLGGRIPSARSMTMLPSTALRNAIWVPASTPRCSRICFGMVIRPSLVTLVGIALSGRQFVRDRLSKSTLAPMVNRVLTSPYLWWFDRCGAGPRTLRQIPRPLLKVLAFQTWQ